MTDEQIQSLLELCERATAGPWFDDEGRYCHDHAHQVCELGRTWTVRSTGQTPHFKFDAKFIAAARTALPQALRELQEARRLLQEATDALDPSLPPPPCWAKRKPEMLKEARAFLSRPEATA